MNLPGDQTLEGGGPQHPVSRRRRASRQTRVQATSWWLGTVDSRIISCHLPRGREEVGAGLFWGEAFGDVIVLSGTTMIGLVLR